jgi:ubiquitin C-terminal hydrolase
MKQDTADTTILKEWLDLRETMWSNDCATVSPNKFVYMIQMIARQKQKELFTGFAQNDFTEFLLFIMDCFHNSICRPIQMNIKGKEVNEIDKIATKTYECLKRTYSKEYSEIMELFYGIYLSNIYSIVGNHKYSNTPELFFTTDLPIPLNMDRITLYDCFDYYTSPEYITGDNAWYNEMTGKKEEVIKKISFWSLPTIFIITLKRFHATHLTKMNHLVEFPVDELDMTPYIEGYHPKEYKYELFGICNHIGNVSGGHYTSFVKNIDGEWNHFNDNHIERVTNPESIITPMAYCLFYRKKNKYL